MSAHAGAGRRHERRLHLRAASRTGGAGGAARPRRRCAAQRSSSRRARRTGRPRTRQRRRDDLRARRGDVRLQLVPERRQARRGEARRRRRAPGGRPRAGSRPIAQRAAAAGPGERPRGSARRRGRRSSRREARGRTGIAVRVAAAILRDDDPDRAGRLRAARLRLVRAAAARDERDDPASAPGRSGPGPPFGFVAPPQSWRSTGRPSVPVIVPTSTSAWSAEPHSRGAVPGPRDERERPRLAGAPVSVERVREDVGVRAAATRSRRAPSTASRPCPSPKSRGRCRPRSRARRRPSATFAITWTSGVAVGVALRPAAGEVDHVHAVGDRGLEGGDDLRRVRAAAAAERRRQAEHAVVAEPRRAARRRSGPSRSGGSRRSGTHVLGTLAGAVVPGRRRSRRRRTSRGTTRLVERLARLRRRLLDGEERAGDDHLRRRRTRARPSGSRRGTPCPAPLGTGVSGRCRRRRPPPSRRRRRRPVAARSAGRADHARAVVHRQRVARARVDACDEAEAERAWAAWRRGGRRRTRRGGSGTGGDARRRDRPPERRDRPRLRGVDAREIRLRRDGSTTFELAPRRRPKTACRRAARRAAAASSVTITVAFPAAARLGTVVEPLARDERRSRVRPAVARRLERGRGGAYDGERRGRSRGAASDARGAHGSGLHAAACRLAAVPRGRVDLRRERARQLLALEDDRDRAADRLALRRSRASGRRRSPARRRTSRTSA